MQIASSRNGVGSRCWWRPGRGERCRGDRVRVNDVVVVTTDTSSATPGLHYETLRRSFLLAALRLVSTDFHIAASVRYAQQNVTCLDESVQVGGKRDPTWTWQRKKNRGYTVCNNFIIVIALQAPSWLQRTFNTLLHFIMSRSTRYSISAHNSFVGFSLIASNKPTNSFLLKNIHVLIHITAPITYQFS